MQRFTLMALAVVGSINAGATEICGGKIKNIAVRHTGEVRLITTFQSSDAHFTICNIDSPWKGVSTNVCKMWVSQAQVAYAAERHINLYYPDGTSCATFVGESVPRPDWFILKPNP